MSDDRCSRCGQVVPVGVRFCTTCGTEMVRGVVGASPPSASPPAGGGLRTSMGGKRLGAPGPAPGVPTPPTTVVPPTGPTPSAPPPLAPPTEVTGGVYGATPPPMMGAGVAPPTRVQPGVPVAFVPPSPTGGVAAAVESGHARASKLPRVLAGVLGVVALAAIGWFVFQAVGGKGGGAGSADAAVNKLVKAVNAKDVAGAVATLNPAEVDELGDALTTVQDRASKTGAAPEGDALAGFDAKIDGIELSDEKLADDVVKVNLDEGNADFDFDTEKLATRIKSLDPRSKSVSLERDDLVLHHWIGGGNEVKVDPFVIVVKRSGGWYLSPEYTALQYWVEANDLPDPDFSMKLPTDLKGGSTPKEALEGFANSIDRMDVEDWMAYVPENERRALWAYQDAIDKFVKQGNYEGSFSFNVRDLEVDQKSLSGGGKALTVSSARGTAKGGADEDKTDWRYDGRCIHSDSSNKFCADHRFEAVDSLYYPLFGAFGVMGDGGTVVATKDHGGWVISPLASIARTLKSQFSNASTEELYAWIGVPMLAPTTGPLTLGQRKSGTFNKGGYAVFDVSLDKGTQYVYERDATTRADQDCEQFGYDSSGGCSGYLNDRFFGPSADAIPYLDIGATGDDATEAFTVDHSGENRLVIFGKPGGRYSILFGVVAQRAWPSGTNNASGTLTRDEPAVAYKFQLGEGAQAGTWQIGVQNGDASIQVFTSDGAQVTSEGNGYELEQGVAYLLVVSGQVGTTYDVALEQGGATIDGQTSIDGSLDEGYERSYDLSVVGSSSTTIDLSIDDPSADLDLFFTATGGSCSDDQSAGYDSIESITVDGPCAGTLKVLARNDSSYTLSVEQ